MLTEINSSPERVQTVYRPSVVSARDKAHSGEHLPSHSRSSTQTLDSLSVSKWSLLRIQHRCSSIKGHRCCSKSVVPNRVATYSNAGGSARIEGITYCNSGLCIVCGMKTLVDKSNKLAKVMEYTKDNNEYLLTTVTVNSNGSAVEQLDTMGKSWKVHHNRMKSWCKRRDSEYDVSWSMDVTVDVVTGKIHLHRHCIVRLTKGNVDVEEFEQVWKDTWVSSVDRATGQIAVRAAQYCKPVQDIEAGSKYLFKSTVEAMGGANKANSYSGRRVGIFGLLRLIAKYNSPKLIGYYKELVGSFGEASMKWSRIGTKINKDYKEIELEEHLNKEDTEEVEEEKAPTITIERVAPQAHRLMMDSGVFPYLIHTLNSGYKDGDDVVEYLRLLLDDIGKCKQLPYSVDKYVYWCKELQWWAKVYHPSLYSECKDRGLTYV